MVGPANSLVPTGTLDFVDGSTTLATIPLDATGAATYATSALMEGMHNITAVYAGDTNFAPSTSSVTVVQVDPAP